jgi:predicted Zn-dependent peptidase
MFSTYDWFQTYLEQLSRVSPHDLQQAARKILRGQSRVVGIYLPEASEVKS